MTELNKTIQVLLMGDPHFKKDNLPLMKVICDETLQLIRNRKPDLFICLGDVLDTHERVHILPETVANNFLLACGDLVDTVVLIGNHDRENNQVFQTDVHPFNGLKGHPRIRVVDKSYWDRDLNFMYAPYVPPGRLREAMSITGWKPDGPQPRVGFAHQEIKGARMGPVVSEHGDIWSTDMFPLFLGHLHDYQIIGNVVYVGTPYQTKYGDDPDKAMMMVYITPELIRMERIPIVGIKKKKIIHMNKDDLPQFQDILQQYPLYDIKVVLNLNESDQKAVQNSPEFIALKQMVDKLTIKTISTNVSLAAVAMEKLQVQDRLSLDDVVIKMLENDTISSQIYRSEII